MIRKVSGTVLAMLIVGTGLTAVSHAKDPWKDYYKAQEKQEKAYWKFRRKQAHEWESRVAGLRCRNPAPSEPDVLIAPHPAQASAALYPTRW